jgi:hypothetical protein
MPFVAGHDIFLRMHIPRNIALTYRNAKDKRQAIHDILNIQDARAFYEASGVRPKTVNGN